MLAQHVKFITEKIDFNRIKHVLDQLQGCYKEKYRWFAAYYLLCRQVIYIADILTEFVSTSADFYYTDRYLYKYLSLLVICILIMIIHIWVQPYKEKSLNMFDGIILLTLVFAIVANFTVSYLTQRLLWILPLIIFVCYMTHSTKLKHMLLPLFCILIVGYSLWCMIKIYIDTISLIFVLISSYLLIKYIKRTCCQKPDNNGDEPDDDSMEVMERRYDVFTHVKCQLQVHNLYYSCMHPKGMLVQCCIMWL